MRFLMFMIPNIPEKDWMPTPEMVAAMTRYNAELTQAGALVSLDGLQPISKGARVAFARGKPTVNEGPFDHQGVIGGYWIIQAKSKQEAIDWAKRVPAADGNVIEVRQIFEMADFSPEVRKAAGL